MSVPEELPLVIGTAIFIGVDQDALPGQGVGICNGRESAYIGGSRSRRKQEDEKDGENPDGPT